MRKTIYFCDKCKKQIEESDVHDLLIRATDNEGPNDAHYDLCFQCICEETKKLFNLFMGDGKGENSTRVRVGGIVNGDYKERA